MTEPAHPAPGGSRESLRSTDPAIMRAMAHPLRLEILHILGNVDEATASEIAERTDQTVANCSFHLRQLAGAGLIERAAPRGREKPWRTRHSTRDLRPDANVPGSVQQSGLLGATVVQREAARMTDFLSRLPTNIEPQLIPTVTITTSTFWATPEELVELSNDINRLAERFEGRQDPAGRPVGALKSHFFGTVNPELPDHHQPAASEADPHPRASTD